METNTLVTHKKLRTLGIGCVSKKLSKGKVKVNFGTDDTMTCSEKALNPIDTSKCKTVSFQKYRNRIMMADKTTKNLNYAIVGNELKHFVGIGWVTQRVVTHGDLEKYPRVVD
jgi:hypothetical protein